MVSTSSIVSPPASEECPRPDCQTIYKLRGKASHERKHVRQDEANGVVWSPADAITAGPTPLNKPVPIDLTDFEDNKLPEGDAPLNLKTLVRKRLELVVLPVLILVLAVVRFEATITWLLWPAVAIAAGGMAWYSVLQARARIVWTFRIEGDRVVLWGSNWLKADAEKLPEAAKYLFGKSPEWWIDAMDDPENPIAFDAHTIERPSHVIPSLVARNIHQQDVHTFSVTKAARKSQNIALGVYGFIAAALLVFLFAVIDKHVGGDG